MKMEMERNGRKRKDVGSRETFSLEAWPRHNSTAKSLAARHTVRYAAVQGGWEALRQR